MTFRNQNDPAQSQGGQSYNYPTELPETIPFQDLSLVLSGIGSRKRSPIFLGYFQPLSGHMGCHPHTVYRLNTLSSTEPHMMGLDLRNMKHLLF